MSRWRTKGWVLVLGLMLGAALPAQAQSKAGGMVSGTVTDESGGVLPGANVQLTGPGINRFQTTGTGGTYTFPALPAGAYRVTATVSGFTTGSQPVTVAESGTAQVPAIALKVAVRGEEVVVTASRSET